MGEGGGLSVLTLSVSLLVDGEVSPTLELLRLDLGLSMKLEFDV